MCKTVWLSVQGVPCPSANDRWDTPKPSHKPVHRLVRPLWVDGRMQGWGSNSWDTQPVQSHNHKTAVSKYITTLAYFVHLVQLTQPWAHMVLYSLSSVNTAPKEFYFFQCNNSCCSLLYAPGSELVNLPFHFSGLLPHPTPHTQGALIKSVSGEWLYLDLKIWLNNLFWSNNEMGANLIHRYHYYYLMYFSVKLPNT